jgi:hypothetical protein
VGKIICSCHKTIFDGLVLKIRVGQFSKGKMNIKCPSCHRWLEGISMELLGESEEVLDLRDARKEEAPAFAMR